MAWVHGTLKIEGDLPKTMPIAIQAVRHDEPHLMYTAYLDARNQFSISNMLPGQYDIAAVVTAGARNQLDSPTESTADDRDRERQNHFDDINTHSCPRAKYQQAMSKHSRSELNVSESNSSDLMIRSKNIALVVIFVVLAACFFSIRESASTGAKPAWDNKIAAESKSSQDQSKPLQPPAQESSTREETGDITGRISADDGRPMQHMRVSLVSKAKKNARSYGTTTDENGNFVFRSVNPGVYAASARCPGYIPYDSIEAAATEAQGYLPGDYISLRMVKGAAITGKVTDQDGHPLMEINVTAIRLRDPSGKAVYSQDSRITRLTDDRGIYRLYGLKPGSYVVRAFGRSRVLNPYLNDSPVYHPFGFRESAKEIIVSAGSELPGVDIELSSDTWTCNHRCNS